MLTLILIRHAKSSWSEPYGTDKLRPLKKRGLKNAPEMGRYIKQQKLLWDVMYSSPALRAKSTADLICKALDKPWPGYVVEQHLYAFDYHEVMAFLKSRHVKLKTIALVGHNPAFTDLTNLLTDAGIKNIPTTGLVEIRLSIKKWSQIKPGCGELLRFESPKRLEATKQNVDRVG